MTIESVSLKISGSGMDALTSKLFGMTKPKLDGTAQELLTIGDSKYLVTDAEMSLSREVTPAGHPNSMIMDLKVTEMG